MTPKSGVKKAIMLLLLITVVLSACVAAYQIDEFHGYEDGYFNAEVIDGKILISGVTGSLVNNQEVDWFKAKTSRYGDWVHATIVNGTLNIEPIKSPY